MTASRTTSVRPPSRPFTQLALVALVATGALAVSVSGIHAQETGPTVEFHPPVGTGMTDLPFSEAVRVGSMLYLSGQVGVDPETDELVSGGIQAETRQTMENIRSALRRHGSSMERVVKCTVFLADMSEWGVMNEVYVSFFPEHKPARSAMGASGLALGARVEIECIGVVGAARDSGSGG